MVFQEDLRQGWWTKATKAKRPSSPECLRETAGWCWWHGRWKVGWKHQQGDITGLEYESNSAPKTPEMQEDAFLRSEAQWRRVFQGTAVLYLHMVLIITNAHKRTPVTITPFLILWVAGLSACRLPVIEWSMVLWSLRPFSQALKACETCVDDCKSDVIIMYLYREKKLKKWSHSVHVSRTCFHRPRKKVSFFSKIEAFTQFPFSSPFYCFWGFSFTRWLLYSFAP